MKGKERDGMRDLGQAIGARQRKRGGGKYCSEGIDTDILWGEA